MVNLDGGTLRAGSSAFARANNANVDATIGSNNITFDSQAFNASPARSTSHGSRHGDLHRAAGTVTLAKNLKVEAMQFSTDDYVIKDDGKTVSLLGIPHGAPSLVRVDPGVGATIAADLVGSGGLHKADIGSLAVAQRIPIRATYRACPAKSQRTTSTWRTCRRRRPL